MKTSNMFREAVLEVTSNPQVRKLVTASPLFAPLKNRFIAGENQDQALAVVRRLNSKGLKATLDCLGEDVQKAEDTSFPVSQYVKLLSSIRSQGLDANVSLKLSQLGLKIDKDLTRKNLLAIVGVAELFSNFVRIDMEGSQYTQDTLDIFYDVFDAHKNVGVVIQSALVRSAADIRDLNEIGARVRLCKGAYKEPDKVAYQDKRQVDINYRNLMKRLLSEGNYPALATHDQRIIELAKTYAARKAIQPGTYEFQMLYGVRPNLQQELSNEGYTVRTYVPFSPAESRDAWYPYFTRRLAERPANLLFFLNSLTKN